MNRLKPDSLYTTVAMLQVPVLQGFGGPSCIRQVGKLTDMGYYTL